MGTAITVLNLEVGETRKVRAIGQTKTGKPHDLEAINDALETPGVADLVQDGTDLTLVSITGLAAGTTALVLDADGRIGEGVTSVHAVLPIVVHEVDATSAVFEDVTDDAPPA